MGLFRECFRVLKEGGVLRVACPDAEYLYNVSKCGKRYWEWIRPWFEARDLEFDNIRPVDCLISEICTPKLIDFGWLDNKEDYAKAFEPMDMDQFLRFVTKDVPYNVQYVGDHINFWTFEKMVTLLRDAGFKTIIRSKCGASICYEMQNTVFLIQHILICRYM